MADKDDDEVLAFSVSKILASAERILEDRVSVYPASGSITGDSPHKAVVEDPSGDPLAFFTGEQTAAVTLARRMREIIVGMIVDAARGCRNLPKKNGAANEGEEGE